MFNRSVVESVDSGSRSADNSSAKHTSPPIPPPPTTLGPSPAVDANAPPPSDPAPPNRGSGKTAGRPAPTRDRILLCQVPDHGLAAQPSIQAVGPIVSNVNRVHQSASMVGRSTASVPAIEIEHGPRRLISSQDFPEPWRRSPREFLYSRMKARAGGVRGAQKDKEGRDGGMRKRAQHETRETNPASTHRHREIDKTNPPRRPTEVKCAERTHPHRPVRPKSTKRTHLRRSSDAKSTKRTQGQECMVEERSRCATQNRRNEAKAKSACNANRSSRRRRMDETNPGSIPAGPVVRHCSESSADVIGRRRLKDVGSSWTWS
jgi:hypothetical protein